jgi:hypothetical protein
MITKEQRNLLIDLIDDYIEAFDSNMAVPAKSSYISYLDSLTDWTLYEEFSSSHNTEEI